MMMLLEATNENDMTMALSTPAQPTTSSSRTQPTRQRRTNNNLKSVKLRQAYVLSMLTAEEMRTTKIDIIRYGN